LWAIRQFSGSSSVRSRLSFANSVSKKEGDFMMNLNRFSIPALVVLLGVTCFSGPKANGLVQGPPQGYGQDRGGWDAPPGEWNEVQRRAFHDGIEGARRDADNHRRPDVNNRDEYRNPNVPSEYRHAYREGFRRGYDVGVSHLMSGSGYEMRVAERSWDAPESGWNEMERRGFHDGIEGARRDFDNHRRPDVNNRDEYRHPDVPHEARSAYREGFRRGYDRGVSHLMGDRGHDHDRDHY
jgi:hypothetical protein